MTQLLRFGDSASCNIGPVDLVWRSDGLTTEENRLTVGTNDRLVIGAGDRFFRFSTAYFDAPKRRASVVFARKVDCGRVRSPRKRLSPAVKILRQIGSRATLAIE